MNKDEYNVNADDARCAITVGCSLCFGFHSADMKHFISSIIANILPDLAIQPLWLHVIKFSSVQSYYANRSSLKYSWVSRRETSAAIIVMKLRIFTQLAYVIQPKAICYCSSSGSSRNCWPGQMSFAFTSSTLPIAILYYQLSPTHFAVPLRTEGRVELSTAMV